MAASNSADRLIGIAVTYAILAGLVGMLPEPIPSFLGPVLLFTLLIFVVFMAFGGRK